MCKKKKTDTKIVKWLDVEIRTAENEFCEAEARLADLEEAQVRYSRYKSLPRDIRQEYTESMDA